MTCGIYSIANKTNGKMYIGQSKDIEKRFRQHKNHLNKNTHVNQHLQNAWDKYGEHSFNFNILLVCPEHELDTEEQKFIRLYATYKKGYNLTWGGDFNPMKHPEIAEKVKGANNGNKVKSDARIKKDGTKDGKQLYRLVYNGKELYQSFYVQNLVERFATNYPNIPITNIDNFKDAPKLKKYAVVSKGSKTKDNKQRYKIYHNKKVVKSSINQNLLVDWFCAEYPLEIIKPINNTHDVGGILNG